MKPLDIIKAKGKSIRLDELLTSYRVLKKYTFEVLIEITSSTTSQVNVKTLAESVSGKAIADITTPIRVVVNSGVTINPYAHTGSTGIDAITLEGIPSDKTVILENNGIIIGSAGLGGEGTYGGSNQTRYGSVAHGGSCVKMVNLYAFILINNGLMYGGKGVGANGSGGRGGNGSINSTTTYSFGGCSDSMSSPRPSSFTAGLGGNGGEWDGYGFSSWTQGKLNGSTTWSGVYNRTNWGCSSPYEYMILASTSVKSYAGGGTSNASHGSADFTGSPSSGFAGLNAIVPPNGGSQGGAGGKGNVAVGYGRGASGGAGGSSGGNAGATHSISGYWEGTTYKVVFTDGADGGGAAGSAGSQGAYGNGGGALTNATITNLTIENNGTILSGKDLDANRGGYLL